VGLELDKNVYEFDEEPSFGESKYLKEYNGLDKQVIGWIQILDSDRDIVIDKVWTDELMKFSKQKNKKKKK